MFVRIADGCEVTYSERLELRAVRTGRVLAVLPRFKLESLILAQNERWRSALDMQVVRERRLRVTSKVAHG